ncbi:hypothetical protein V6N11_002389 [Hibiscus sabdariffa]|uniref:Uncharacterized protein n=1 Tax=Hibiscus sabdariffa TaxID=183260 RepID=A0ABR2SA12_9ROSI
MAVPSSTSRGFTIRAERQPSGEPTMAGPAQAQKVDTPSVSKHSFLSSIDLGFDPATSTSTSTAVYSAGLTIHKYLNLAYRFTSFKDGRIREKLLSLGSHTHMWLESVWYFSGTPRMARLDLASLHKLITLEMSLNPRPSNNGQMNYLNTN